MRQPLLQSPTLGPHGKLEAGTAVLVIFTLQMGG